MLSDTDSPDLYDPLYLGSPDSSPPLSAWSDGVLSGIDHLDLADQGGGRASGPFIVEYSEFSEFSSTPPPSLGAGVDGDLSGVGDAGTTIPDRGSDLGPIRSPLYEDWETPRPSTIRRWNQVGAWAQRRLSRIRAQGREDATNQAFSLEGSFMDDERGSTSPLPVLPGSLHQGGGSAVLYSDEETRRRWAQYENLLRSLALWLRGTCISFVDPWVLSDITCYAWTLFCATLRFPKTRAAFENFCKYPSASPEVARFRLLEYGPPPPSLSTSLPFFAKWDSDSFNLSRDDALDVISSADAAVLCLESLIPAMEDVQVSVLHPGFPVDISRVAWKVFIATLRIPESRREFELLCSRPDALWAASGLPSGDPHEPPLGPESSRRRAHRKGRSRR